MGSSCSSTSTATTAAVAPEQQQAQPIQSAPPPAQQQQQQQSQPQSQSQPAEAAKAGPSELRPEVVPQTQNWVAVNAEQKPEQPQDKEKVTAEAPLLSEQQQQQQDAEKPDASLIIAPAAALIAAAPNVDVTDLPSNAAPAPVAPKRIIISGAPASGKGTQCELIKGKYGVVHLSTGDLLRAAVKAGSPLGVAAKSYMDKGDLVPDDLIIDLVKTELESKDCKEKGWLLDGFPRTPEQAAAMEQRGIQADYFILLNVPDEVLIKRVVGRRLDPVTGHIYHVDFNPPPADPEIRSRLITRSDDTEEKARTRLQNYHKHIDSIRDRYTSILHSIDGDRPKGKVFDEINSILSGGTAAKRKPLHLIVAGAPASGKGTQCELIKAKYDIVHISTGDVLRAAVKAGTPIGLQAQQYMDSGQLVPDDVMIGLVKECLDSKECREKGWLLDGFPRTFAQAKALKEAGVQPDRFILIDAPEDILVERVVGRRTDPETGKIYHVKFNPPTDPAVAARLIQRSDDTEEKIKVRIAAFNENIRAIADTYSAVQTTVHGGQDKHAIFLTISKALDPYVL